MSRFIQLHLLTSYPPSNLNRDDLGRPKSALVGGVQRLRISSQALKRAWRTSDSFKTALDGHLGVRTKEMGTQVWRNLTGAGIADKPAREWARAIAERFGKLKDAKKTERNEDLEIEQLAHFGPEEQAAINELTKALIGRKSAPTEDELQLLRKPRAAVDIALFGRMLAANPAFNVEAAAQVAHAITVHKAAIEDDYFTAVDDLNKGDEDRGAGHIGETGFGAGVYYLYVCINRALLDENLGGDTALRNRALAALLEAASKTAPTGKQNSFASRAYASCVVAEKSDRQPRSLAAAFLRPVRNRDDQDTTAIAIEALLKKRDSFDAMYGITSDAWRAAAEGEYWPLFPEGRAGSLAQLVDFVQQD
ncbi:MAG TPA: type I-E CRISPR-associated protein Cas7/Cse4/CasC [Rhodanobacteraceae bacterium]